ncbi:MAG: cell division protein FtsQ/DivIB [Vulcanimicrobiota bacterium]
MAKKRTVKKAKKKTTKLPSSSALIVKKVFILFIFIMAQLLFYYSDFFKLKDITIHGNSRVTNEQILKTANIPLDHNIITLPMNTFRKRLNTIHWIKDVKINWSVPGKVDIFVSERKPVILARQNGRPNAWFCLDEYGMALYKTNRNDKNYPRMVIEEPLAVGKPIDSTHILAVRNIDDFIPVDIKENFQYYLVDSHGEVVAIAETANKYKIKFGKDRNIEKKVSRLKAILDMIDNKKIRVKYIDVRYDTPTILPEESLEKKEKSE